MVLVSAVVICSIGAQGLSLWRHRALLRRFGYHYCRWTMLALGLVFTVVNVCTVEVWTYATAAEPLIAWTLVWVLVSAVLASVHAALPTCAPRLPKLPPLPGYPVHRK